MLVKENVLAHSFYPGRVLSRIEIWEGGAGDKASTWCIYFEKKCCISDIIICSHNNIDSTKSLFVSHNSIRICCLAIINIQTLSRCVCAQYIPNTLFPILILGV